MGRYTADVLKILNAVGLPDPTLGSNPQTQGQWGIDMNALLLVVDGDLSLSYAGDPNGNVASNYVSRKCFDTTRNKIWACSTIGTAGTAVWVDSTNPATIDVRHYGAIPDAKMVYDIVCTSGSATATSATAAFTTADQGKVIKIRDIANNAYIFQGTILTRNSATSITLSGNATANCSSGNGLAAWGTNNLTAVQNALTAADNLVPGNINGPNFPVGSGQARVIFPVDTRGAAYMIGSGAGGLTVGRNVVIDADAMLISNVGNGTSDRTWFMSGTGFHINNLVGIAMGGMGVDLGTVSVNSASKFKIYHMWDVGTNFNGALTPNGQIGLRFTGYDFYYGEIWVKGGNIGFHCNQGADIFGASPMELIGCSVALQATSMENAHIDFVCDTGSFLAAAIDGSRSSTIRGRAFSVVSTTLTYGIQLGEYDSTNLNRGLDIEYTGQRTGGVGAKISYTEDSRIKLLLTNAALFSASGGAMTAAITYGSGNTGSLYVDLVRDGAISTVYSGTVVGMLRDFSDGVTNDYGPTLNITLKKAGSYGTTANATVVIPAGQFITGIVFKGNNANAVTGGIKIGTSSGATDVVAAQAVAGNSLAMITDAALLKKVFSYSVDQTLYVQAVSAWNSANVDIVFIIGNL